ncbi:MAG: efflux RND transporter periplasmic adaptor subunit [Aristaeellaceae bacterium]
MSETNQTALPRKRPRRKRHILRRLLTSLLVLVLLAGAGWYTYASLKAEYTIQYTGYTATMGSISNALSFSGSLALIDSQTFTAGSSATVRSIYVAAGQDVQKGARLMRLSNGESITAEFDGRVNTISVEEGDEVSAGASLLQVADFTHMKVSIRVDEYDISSVQVGQRCTVTATATEQEFESTIAAIDYISASTGNVAYYTATAYVDVGDGIYPGMQVSVTIPQEEAENVVIVKMDALSFDETNSAYVYMTGEDGTLTQVPVEVGVSNGNYVEIKSGLNAGDEVYVETEVKAADSGLSSLMSSLFGGQQMTAPSGSGSGRGNRDFSNFDPSNMPSGGAPSGGFGGGK